MQSGEIYFKIISLGARGDLLVDLICGELIKVKVLVSYPAVCLQICKSAIELCMASLGLHVVTPPGVMCLSHNLRQLVLLMFFILYALASPYHNCRSFPVEN